MATEPEAKAGPVKPLVTTPQILEWGGEADRGAQIELISAFQVTGVCATATVVFGESAEGVAKKLEQSFSESGCEATLVRVGSNLKLTPTNPNGSFTISIREDSFPSVEVPPCGQKLLLNCGLSACVR